ncbi:transcription factor TGA6-like [Andrographis paniculata]|uniref:transcription factor TGA6-like n=1 Tax=Andrographis paniculata TaxID=175694 RepID=UPI0021E90228|nr:transcription factor TGA6-like [Andrographis paniculata]XP_051144795.1 transcription factor TGA6-like [Andrographis paniculata]
MQSYKAYVPQQVSLTSTDLYCNSQSPFYLRGDDIGRHGALGESTGNAFIHIDDVNLSRGSDYSSFKASNVSSVMPNNLQFGEFTNSLGSGEIESSGIMGLGASTESLSNGHFKHWGDSLLEHHQKLPTDTSTNAPDHTKSQFPVVQHKSSMAMVDSISMDSSKAVNEQKALRRQAQNREAARKCRKKRKEYIQQLEDSRKRLNRLEKEIKRTRTQGTSAASGTTSVDRSHSVSGSGGSAFDVEYTQWLDDHRRLIDDLRSAVNSNASDAELQLLVDEVMLHYKEVFRLKSSGAKTDVFHILSGMWKTPAERCFMWLGGFRSSEILKVLRNQIEHLTEKQKDDINSLQGSSLQTEDALNLGMEALQQSLVEKLSNNSSGSSISDNVAEYMEQMTVAMSKLVMIGDFLHQADLLRLKTLQQLQRILSTNQAARALIAFSDYNSRIRALSSLWLARPRD